MARPRNPGHRDALLAAATRVFAAEGLGASTSAIARDAGVSAGTLFVYFETKSTLVNDLYVALKTEMARRATEDLPAGSTPREQLRSMWCHWVAWATDQPDKRRALAHLGVAEEVTGDSRRAVHAAYADIAETVAGIVADGPMRELPLGFAMTLMSAITDATIDDLLRDPDPSGTRSARAFDAMWRALAG